MAFCVFMHHPCKNENCFFPSEVSLPVLDGGGDRLSTEAFPSLGGLSLSLTDSGAFPSAHSFYH